MGAFNVADDDIAGTNDTDAIELCAAAAAAI